MGKAKVSTYVPFRNGLMLSAVASLAMSLFVKGRCGYLPWRPTPMMRQANAYADCSEAFTDAMG